jgi:DNA-binding GntR family transcriptional regulator
LVTLSRHRGASVADLSLSELEDIYSIRIAIEGYGAFLAARNISGEDLERLEAALRQMREVFEQGDRWRLLEINRQFYEVLYAIADRPRLYELIMKHLDLASLYRQMAFAIDHYYRHTIADHEALIATFRQHDPEAAERLTRTQLQQTLVSLVAFLEGSA